jgi:hypothetical protein
MELRIDARDRDVLLVCSVVIAYLDILGARLENEYVQRISEVSTKAA